MRASVPPTPFPFSIPPLFFPHSFLPSCLCFPLPAPPFSPPFLQPFLGSSDSVNQVSGKIKLGKEVLATLEGHWVRHALHTLF